jgi:uncharacterized membrane protein
MMARMPQAMEKLIGRVEQAAGLDGAAATTQGWLRKAVPGGAAEDVLRGAPLGHPLHPALVQVPLGAWLSAIVTDALGEPAAARKLTAIGCAAAVPTALAGGVDWLSTEGPARRVGLVHGAVNDAALVVFTMSWRARRKGRRGRGFLLSLLGSGLITAGGWLGAHLAYSLGVGVDTTDFRRRHAGANQRDGADEAATRESATA